MMKKRVRVHLNQVLVYLNEKVWHTSETNVKSMPGALCKIDHFKDRHISTSPLCNAAHLTQSLILCFLFLLVLFG